MLLRRDVLYTVHHDDTHLPHARRRAAAIVRDGIPTNSVRIALANDGYFAPAAREPLSLSWVRTLCCSTPGSLSPTPKPSQTRGISVVAGQDAAGVSDQVW